MISSSEFDKLNGCCVQTKRRRTANYTTAEKQILLNLVRKYVHIIEKKKNDAGTWREKEACWKQITDDFNAQPRINMRRSTESLKYWFENQKKTARRRLAQKSRDNCLCTEKDSVNNLTISNITNTSSISSDDSLLDSNADIVAIKSENEEFEEVVIEENDDKVLKKNESTQTNAETYILVAEQEPPSLQLPNQNCLLQKTQKLGKLKPWPHRKRAFVSRPYSLSKYYNYKLSNIKLKVAQYELETLKMSFQAREEREKVEHQLKMKSLQLDLDIKQELLNKIKQAKPEECLQNLLVENFVT